LNNLIVGGADADKMTGRKGNDIYVVENTRDTVTENVNEGTDTVLSPLTYTLGANVENLTLTGSAAINGTGNALKNVLKGNDSNNTLNGGAGADRMIGGRGSDTYVVDDAGDVVMEDDEYSDIDTVQSAVSFTLGAYVDNLTLTGTANINGTGNEWNNVLTGNGGANTLIGGEGYDTLNGGAGADIMTGGIGDDMYVVDNAADSVTESANEGTDTVQSSLAYTLGANVENLTLTGKSALSGTGNELDNVLTGNSGANTLTGYAGNDTLNGGAGADTMRGGIGNDTYVADSTSDVVIENPNEGIDTVKSSVSCTLGAHVENLMISDGDWTSVSTRLKITATGNVLDNLLKDDGSVTMAEVKLVGGAGNDIYEVRNNDVVVENLNEGIDTILSSGSYTLGANVENLTLTSNQAYDGTGNMLDNVITGSSAVNTLTGNNGNDTLVGNTGNDTLTGGSGSDKYIFRRTDGMDTINETAEISSDTDTVKMTDGISETEPVIVKQNNDLYLFIDSNNYMRVTNQFYQPDYGVERLEVTDGYYITRSDIENIVNTMNAINNDPGMDVIQKYNAMRVDQTYINTLAQSWHQQ
jgi:Ca2+-binding RTX toxin-like protein